MSKFLFLCSGYYPETTPNGVCLRMVALELLHMGHEVHIICQDDIDGPSEICYEGIFLHYIKSNIFLRLRKFGEQHPKKMLGRISYVIAMCINKIQKILLLPWYPLNHPLSLYKFYKTACNLNKNYNFDRVIGIYCPLEATYAVIKYKKKFPQCKVSAYVLDSLIYMSGASYFPKKVAEWLQWRVERKVYEGVDRVFNMRCHEVHHKALKYDKYREKMSFLDIPLFKSHSSLQIKQNYFDHNFIQFVYMGTLFENYREPYYLCRIASELSKKKQPIQIQFYTRGSCEAKLSEISKCEPELVCQHGYVSHSLVEEIYANSDFLINIGVNRTTMISSKIFDYMAYGKPIIHFYYQDDDVNNRYLQEYPLCCMIQMKDELYSKNLDKLWSFIELTKGKIIDSKYLINKFKENTPEYTAQAFVNL